MNGHSLNTPERWGKPGEWVQTPMDANAFTPERWGKPGNGKPHQPIKTGKNRETPL